MKRIFALITVLLLVGCSGGDDNAALSYTQITVDEAVEMMSQESGYIILDVRTAAEYAEGHIPNAINYANEDIGESAEEILPDKEQLILVYCRSGRRSKEASQKLVDLGYSTVYEFGGIIDWTGKLRSNKMPPTLR